ncbi:YdeI/OmpD-associated family protein [Pedobacter sp. P351]|uniref:YdeI/OmpD-associated family protein n=1 Tax=Pedobacter superstes TaxID=3133441 RepID=UPI0030A2926F
MGNTKTIKFSALIEIIGINPFVYLPENVLNFIFLEAGESKGKIPVKIKIEGHEFPQTLIKYSGHWRLYLNTPMRKAAKKDVGDNADFEIAFDKVKREIPMHSKLLKALQENEEARKIFDNLRPSLQHEIIRYLSFLKTEESVERNVTKAIGFLLGQERFIGRDKP